MKLIGHVYNVFELKAAEIRLIPKGINMLPPEFERFYLPSFPAWELA